jgi:UDP:flavonoid glycosyltransferase YjiC (YdhE family)
VTLLVISPDYASHVIPLLTIARAWHRRGHRVVVATGDAVAPLVTGAGSEHVRLVMSRGSNAGIARVGTATPAEGRSLEAFFAATRRGMVGTLRYQAEARAVDLLWQPRLVARRTIRIVERLRPDAVLVDHLAFAATIGLRALGVPYGDVVLGHPAALPVGDEVYGVPSAWPTEVHVDPLALAELRSVSRQAGAAFSEAYDRALRALAPDHQPVGDAFRAHGEIVLYNYPVDLHPAERTALLPPRHAFLGSAVRDELPDDATADWLARADGRPLVVVSFGTFLSARGDVLARVAGALRRVTARVALAVGDQQLGALGPIPDDWFVRDRLPLVALLQHANLLVTHGGNNSVTEALTHGVPMLVLPFSTDQFDAAAAIERHLLGLALDPNHASRPLIEGSVRGLLASPPAASALIGRQLRGEPGPEVAYRAVSTDDHDTLPAV